MSNGLHQWQLHLLCLSLVSPRNDDCSTEGRSAHSLPHYTYWYLSNIVPSLVVTASVTANLHSANLQEKLIRGAKMHFFYFLHKNRREPKTQQSLQQSLHAKHKSEILQTLIWFLTPTHRAQATFPERSRKVALSYIGQTKHKCTSLYEL